MKSPAHNATTTATEQPFGSFRNVGWSRPGTYVPVATISPTPDWVPGVAAAHHGSHEILSGTTEDCWCMLFVRFGRNDGLPPGDWLIYYSYNDTDGTHDHQLCVAARIAQ